MWPQVGPRKSLTGSSRTKIDHHQGGTKEIQNQMGQTNLGGVLTEANSDRLGTGVLGKHSLEGSHPSVYQPGGSKCPRGLWMLIDVDSTRRFRSTLNAHPTGEGKMTRWQIPTRVHLLLLPDMFKFK